MFCRLVHRTLLLFVAFSILTSCLTEKEKAIPLGEGFFTYDGTTYDVDDMYIEMEYTNDDGFPVYRVMITKGFEVTKTRVKGSGNAVNSTITSQVKKEDYVGAFDLNTDGNVSGALLNSYNNSGFDIYFSSGNGTITERRSDGYYYISFSFTEEFTGNELTGEWEGRLSYR